MIVGLFFSIVLAMTDIYGIYELPNGIIPSAVVSLLSLLVVFIVFLYTKKTAMDEKMKNVVAMLLIASGL